MDAETPDLIVLDLMLPEMTGWEVLRELRRRPASRAVPVVVLSARREPEDEVAAVRLGASDYITKPFSPFDLVRRVERALLRGIEPGGATPVCAVC